MGNIFSETYRLTVEIRTKVQSAEIDDVFIDPTHLQRLHELTADLASRCQADRDLWEFPEELNWSFREEMDLTAASCILSEVQDARSQLRQALVLIERVGNDSFVALERLVSGRRALTETQIALLRQRVWAVLFLANSYSRRGHHLIAKDFLELCTRTLDAFVPTEVSPCYGLRARLSYTTGAVYLHIGELSEARTQFRNAIEYTMLGLEKNLQSYTEDSEIVVRQKHARYMLGKCSAFGLARVALATGEVTRALANSASGVALLTGTKDTEHLAYARMVYAMCLRARFEVGDPHTHQYLDSSEVLLTKLCEEFGRSRHKKRAEYELACVKLRRFTLKKAESDPSAASFLKDARFLAEASPDSELPTPTRQAWNQILLSRIYRHLEDYPKAIKHAKDLIADVGENQREAKVGALIALSEAQIEMAIIGNGAGDYALAAEKNLKEALASTKLPSLNAAACRLHLIRSATARNSSEAGQRYLREWQDHKKDTPLENGILRDLERTAIEEFDRKLSPDFFISSKDFTNQSWDELTRRLRTWLVRRWEGEAGGLDAAAASLGVARATLYNWKRDSSEASAKAASGATQTTNQN